MARNGVGQWGWREMEELLQCPVCLDIPAVGVIEQCVHGHHICASCKKNVESCPLCKCTFSGTRNFILEELVRHFDILKNTMLLNNIVSDSKSKKFKRKVLTVRNDTPTQVLKSQPIRRAVHTPSCTSGTYHCRAENCDEELSLARLLNHCRSKHGDIFTQSAVDFTEVYSQTFEIPFRNRNPVNKNSFIVFVSGIGLIYLNIEIMKTGQLIAFIQMASKYTNCQEYLGSLVLFSETCNYSYNTKLVSTRIGFDLMIKQCLCFTLNKNQLKRICENKKFNCKLTLTRFNISNNVNVITTPMKDQISIVAAVRASLITEQSDKKLIKQLEGKEHGKSVTKPTASTSHPHHNGQTLDIDAIVAKVLQSMIPSRTELGNGSQSAPSANATLGRKNSKKKKTRRPNAT